MGKMECWNMGMLAWPSWMPCWANRRPRLFTGGDKVASYRHQASAHAKASTFADTASAYAMPTADKTVDKTADQSLYRRGRLYAQAYPSKRSKLLLHLFSGPHCQLVLPTATLSAVGIVKADVPHWVTGLLLLMSITCLAQTSAPPTALMSPRSLMPAAPIWSNDRMICVRSSMAMAGYRTPVLMFADNARADFFRATRLNFSNQPAPITIFIGNQRDGDKRVLSTRIRFSSEEVIERIELPDPEAADLLHLRRSIWLALYRSWLVSTGEGQEATLTKLPIWMAEGVIRKMDKTTWSCDIDRVLQLWSHASLPSARELLAAKNPASTDPALGTVMVAYLSEHKTSEGKNVLDALIKAAAQGNNWTPERICLTITDTPDLEKLDESLDLWLLSLTQKIVIPGTTTEGSIERFRSNLLIYPSDYGKFFNHNKPCITFYELIQYVKDLQLRQAAASQAKWVRMGALGRDETLGSLAERYVTFLDAFVSGKKSGELMRLLTLAEVQRKELEQTVRNGKTLKSE